MAVASFFGLEQIVRKFKFACFNDFLYTDVVASYDNPLKNGARGQIAVKDLENYVFPFIKYKFGEYSHFIQNKCLCGSNYSLIEPVKGRITDNLIFSNYSVISGEYLAALFDEFIDSIQSFEVYQCNV